MGKGYILNNTMINHKELRESFEHEKIKVLFIAEAPLKMIPFFILQKVVFTIIRNKFSMNYLKRR